MSALHRSVHRTLLAFAAAAAALLLVSVPAASASAAPSAPSAVASASAPCASVRQVGAKKVVSDLGLSAFTVRQYIGWCRDSHGSAWMNFASVYVWDQYHARGTAYRAMSGVAVRGEPEPRGFTSGALRQQLTYSTPVRTTALCTQGWGKLARSGSESAQGLSALVC
jgi:hypothetical protein